MVKKEKKRTTYIVNDIDGILGSQFKYWILIILFINSIFGLQRSKMPSVSEGFLEQT